MTTATSHNQPSWTFPPLHALPMRTIAVTAGSRSRSARLKVRYPHPSDRPCYDAALASELLGRTSELPDSKHDLVTVLSEYRFALHDLITAFTGRSPAAVMNSVLAQTPQHDDKPAADTTV